MSFNSYTTKPSLNDNNNQSNIKDNNNSTKKIISNNSKFNLIQNNDKIIKNERYDKYGNLIKKNGKQKITFLDKIEKKRIFEVIEIESFKEYNKLNDIKFNNNGKNNCCVIF